MHSHKHTCEQKHAVLIFAKNGTRQLSRLYNINYKHDNIDTGGDWSCQSVSRSVSHLIKCGDGQVGPATVDNLARVRIVGAEILA